MAIIKRIDRNITGIGNEEVFSRQSLRNLSPAATINSIEITDISDNPNPLSTGANGSTNRMLIPKQSSQIRNNTNVCK